MSAVSVPWVSVFSLGVGVTLSAGAPQLRVNKILLLQDTKLPEEELVGRDSITHPTSGSLIQQLHIKNM